MSNEDYTVEGLWSFWVYRSYFFEHICVVGENRPSSSVDYLCLTEKTEPLQSISSDKKPATKTSFDLSIIPSKKTSKLFHRTLSSLRHSEPKNLT